MPELQVIPTPPITEDELTVLWHRFTERWQDRDERMEAIVRAVNGEWVEFGPDEEPLESRSPNMIQVALEDTASASSATPSIRVMASEDSDGAKRKANVMEKLGASYIEGSEGYLLFNKSYQDLGAYGLFTWVCTRSEDAGPRFEWRDPRTCYPEPDFNALGVINRCFFARDLYLSQLYPEWQVRFLDRVEQYGIDSTVWVDHAVTLVEYYTTDHIVIAGVFDANTLPVGVGGFGLAGNSTLGYAQPNYITTIFEVVDNDIGMCPVIIGQTPRLDGRPRGQFDQVIDVLRAHIQLQALVLDYADQAVYSDVWAKDVLGPMSYGGGSYIQLGPQGEIGRVPPAVTSFSLFNELEQLVDAVHLGGRWPKQRPGEVDQAIASGKFVESTMGVMNEVVRGNHEVMTRALEQGLRILFSMDKKLGPKRTVSGVLKNQQFLLERDRDDIDLSARVKIDYGLGLGRDPAQSMVLAIQGHQAGLFSLDFVQENIEGITDVALERVRIDLRQIRDMMMAQLLEGLQTGSIPKRAALEVYRARQNGEELVKVFEKFVVEPEEELQEQQLTGLGGQPLMPGPPPAGELGAGATAPPAPPPEELLAGLLGAEEPSTINRTSVPTGPGSFTGVQTGG